MLGVHQGDLKDLETDIFEPLVELDDYLHLGFCSDALEFMIKKEWITETSKAELEKFKAFSDTISTDRWNMEDFDKDPDWQLLRKWAGKLFSDLGFENQGLDNLPLDTIYV